MAPPDDRDSNSRKLCTDSFDNPFIAFQRFVDEQISSMLQSVTGLPSTLKNPRSWSRDPETWPEESQRWANDETNDKQLAVSAEKCIPRGEHVVAHFLNESEYSPFNIENDPDLKVFGPLWRQAFGDLMDAAEGRRMAPVARDYNKAEWVAHYVPRWAKTVEDRAAANNPFYAVLREFTTSTDLFEQLQFLGRALADGHGTNALNTDDANEEANEAQVETELEMYERMLAMGNDDSADLRSPTTFPAPSPAPAQKSEPPTSSPSKPMTSIISTLTTTERVTMPDGSVRTRRVLKKRFSDGREESNESEEVQQPRKSSLNERVEDAWSGQNPRKAEETRPEPEEKKKGGWFWS